MVGGSEAGHGCDRRRGARQDTVGTPSADQADAANHSALGVRIGAEDPPAPGPSTGMHPGRGHCASPSIAGTWTERNDDVATKVSLRVPTHSGARIRTSLNAPRTRRLGRSSEWFEIRGDECSRLDESRTWSIISKAGDKLGYKKVSFSPCVVLFPTRSITSDLTVAFQTPISQPLSLYKNYPWSLENHHVQDSHRLRRHRYLG